MNPEFDLKQYLQQKKQYLDDAIQTRWLSSSLIKISQLHDSMEYSFFAGGKRVRAALVFASADALGLESKDVLPIAAALEMIHAFSLIHDDLPAMDDDNFRRGKPTNHKVYGEAIAILAGDALHALAFSVLSELDFNKFDSKNIISLIKSVAEATGVRGMIGGQVIDINSENKNISFDELKQLHSLKTGALIQISAVAPALLLGDKKSQEALQKYGQAIGLAFQIADDILDVEGGEDLGKDIGSDQDKGKSTYVSLLGLQESKQKAQDSLKEALNALSLFEDKAIALKEIAQYIVSRKN